jgi:hypothetical protein
MMKSSKTLKSITILAAILVASMMTVMVSAQSDDFELPDASSVPGDAFYGLERFLEDNLEVPWARIMQGKRGEAAKRMELAEERLAEMKTICNRTDPAALEHLQTRYENHVQKAQALMNGTDTEALEEQMGERLMNHVRVLTRLRQGAPEQARKGIDLALQSSTRRFSEQVDQMAYRLRQMDGNSTEALELREKCEGWMNQTRERIMEWETVREHMPSQGEDVDIEMPSHPAEFRNQTKRGRN